MGLPNGSRTFQKYSITMVLKRFGLRKLLLSLQISIMEIEGLLSTGVPSIKCTVLEMKLKQFQHPFIHLKIAVMHFLSANINTAFS